MANSSETMSSQENTSTPETHSNEAPSSHPNQTNNHAAPQRNQTAANLILSKELEALKAENANLKDQLLRTVADTDNMRKRMERQLEEASKFAISNFAKNLIDSFENLYRATEIVSKDDIDDQPLLKSVLEGVEMTKKSLLATCKNYGLERIAPEPGAEFDHNLHQAVMHVESDTIDTGKIVQLMQAGYTLHDRLIKPAIVSVAKPKGE